MNNHHEILVVQLLLRLFLPAAGKLLGEFAEHIIDFAERIVVYCTTSAFTFAGVSVFFVFVVVICRLFVFRFRFLLNFLEYSRCSHGHQNGIVHECKQRKDNDKHYHYLIQFFNKVQLKHIEGYIYVVQRILDVKVRAVGKLQRLEPESGYCKVRRKRTYHACQSPCYEVQLPVVRYFV